MPGQSNLCMINKFLTIADKLEWPLPVQIDHFIKHLPMSLRQFVISRITNDFEEVCESIRGFQDMLEVDVVTHSFKNVSFADNTCILYGEDHTSLRCPSLKSAIEMETSSKEAVQPRSRCASPDRQSNGINCESRSRLKNRYYNKHEHKDNSTYIRNRELAARGRRCNYNSHHLRDYYGLPQRHYSNRGSNDNYKMSIEVIIITIEVEVLQIIDFNRGLVMKDIIHIQTDPMIIGTGVVVNHKTGMKTVTIIRW